MAQPHYDPSRQRTRHNGFTLIEMIIFIVIIGIAATATLLPLATALERMPAIYYQTTALELAQGRMEILLGRRRLLGYGTTTDACTQNSSLVGCSFSDTRYTLLATFPSSGNVNINVYVTGPNYTKVNLYTTTWFY